MATTGLSPSKPGMNFWNSKSLFPLDFTTAFLPCYIHRNPNPTSMWHVLHHAALPAAFLFGVFCVLTAIVMYPGEEGKIQSKFEDFWIRVDDYQKLALSWHAAFMTQVAKLETRFLDLVFGHKLFSVQAIIVSWYCSFAMLSLRYLMGWHWSWETTEWEFALFASILTLVFCVVLRNSPGLQVFFAVCTLTILVGRILRVPFAFIHEKERVGLILILSIIGGFLCDVLFIATTRQLVRWMAEMSSSLRVIGVVAANLFLAFAMLAPVLIVLRPAPMYGNSLRSNWYYLEGVISVAIPNVAVTNLVDVMLALLFVVLAIILLIHRALWPFLTRTLFKLQDIGTNGRRGILLTVGLSLLGWSGVKLPELARELLKALGKG